MEFRCFVRRRRLVGISQRNTGDFFEFLPGMAAELAQTVEGFFDEFVANEFPAESCARRPARPMCSISNKIAIAIERWLYLPRKRSFACAAREEAQRRPTASDGDRNAP